MAETSKEDKYCVDRILETPTRGRRRGRDADRITETFETFKPAQYVKEARSEITRDPTSPASIFAITRKLWPKRTLRIRFLEGEPEVQRKVRRYARQWTQYARMRFIFVSDNSPADIRISFEEGNGSWSYIGTDALSIEDPYEPTMNYGWLTPNSPDDEYSRVVLHEFGHALGCPHEHQHPQGGIDWNKEAVYEDLSGPPNYWTREQIDHNMFDTYDETITSYSAFDDQSIMLYRIPGSWVRGGRPVGGLNNRLSKTDKQYMRDVFYP